MLVFYKARLAFLSVPKTGTTAYETALRPHADLVISEPSMLKHAPVYRYNRFIRPMFLNVCDVELELMAVMREPISWLGSWWRYRQRPFMQGKPNATHDISFDDFVLAYMKGQKPGFADVGSQFKFLERQPNGTGVTHLFQYENQARLLRFLSERLGVAFSLERENVSPEVPLYLSPEVETRLRRKFDHEFALYDSIPKD
ncbi:gamma-glutamyl kinase [uncultured Tateyamaria sp.]|uniref:gamma-glutamyl kinase n=1 Tax=uncultured Tateyamaria sp. TaxID=455651 RepID=UPI0026321450|nr:gamma-glutamyl kinase [uncultured Tateyamaria sp.]